MDAIADLQTELICQYDPNLRLTYVNRAFSEWLDLPKDQLIGTGFMERIIPEEQPAALAEIRSLTVEHPIAISAHHSILPDNTRATIEWTDRALFDEASCLTGYLGVGRDLTAREQQTQQIATLKDQLTSVLDTMQDAIISLTLPNQQLTYASTSIEKVFGYPLEKILSGPDFYQQIIHPDDLELAIQALQTCQREGFVDFDHRIIWPDSQVRWLNRRAWISSDENGHPVKVIDTARDITDRKQAEAALQNSEKRLGSILEHMQDAVWSAEIPGFEITYANPAIRTIFGRPESDFYQDNTLWMKVMYHEDRPRLGQIHNLVMEEGYRDVEYRIVRPDGEVRWLRDRAWLVKDENGQQVRLDGIATDITERKHFEEALRASEEKYRSLVESTDAAITVADAGGNYLFVNNVAAAPFGVSGEELNGKNIKELFPPLEAEQIMADIDRVLKTEQGKTVEVQVTLAGKPVWFRTNLQPVRDGTGKTYAMLAYSYNTTEEKKIQQAILAQNEILRQSKSLISMANTDRLVTYINEAGVAMMGAESPESLIGIPISGYHPPEDAAYLHDKVLPYILTYGQWHGENRLKALDGHLIEVEQIVFPIRDKQGNLVQLATIMTDITERKKAETEIRASEEKYRSLIESTDAAISMVARNGDYLFLNQIAADPFGVAPEQLVGKNIRDLFPPAEAEHMLADVERIIAENKGQTIEAQVTLGTARRWVRVSTQPVLDGAGSPYATMFFAMDITEKKEAELAILWQNELLRQSGDFIGMSSEKGVVTFINQGAAAMLGVESPQSLIGTPISQYHPPEGIALIRDVAVPYALTNGQWRGENQLKTLDGRLIEVEQLIFPIKDKQGNVAQLATIMTDITERKRAENTLRVSEKRYRQMFEVNGLPKLIVDPADGRLVDANPAAVKYYGYDLPVLKTMKIYGINQSAPEEINAKMASALTNQLISFQCLHRLADGSLREVEVYSGPLEYEDRQLLYSTVTDITERERAKAALEEANRTLEQRVAERTAELEKVNNQLEAIFNHSGDAILLLDVAQGIQQANFTFEQLTATQAADYQGQSLQTFLQPENAHQVTAALQKVVTTHQKQEIEAQTLTGIEVEISLAPVNRSNSTVTNVVGIIRDVTERKQAEQALRESEERYRQTIAAMSEGLVVQDKAGAIQLCNASTERILGLSAEQMMGRTSVDPGWRSIHADGSDFGGETHPAMLVLKTGQPQSNVVMGVSKPDGLLTWILINSQPLVDQQEQTIAAITTFTDITERKKVEETIRESEERYRLLAENVTDIIVKYTPDSVCTYITPSVYARLGYTPQELIGKPMTSLVHPDDLAMVYENSHTAIISKAPSYTLSHRMRHKDGHYEWIESTNTPLRDKLTGQPLEGIAVFRDITGRKRAEEELQALSRRLQLATEAGKIGIWDWDIAKDKLYWDDQMLAFYGLTREELTGTAADYWKQIHPEDYSQLQEAITLANEGIKPFDTEFRIIDKENKIIHLKGRAQVLRDETGKPVQIIGVNWDITPLKQAENALKQALEKEKELSELKTRFVSMASHEFRTPLASILAITEAMINYRDRMDGTQINTRLDKIRQQVLHLKEIMDDVLQQARFQAGRVEFKPQSGDLDVFCRDIIEEFESQAANQGRLKYECSSHPLTTSYDQHLMRQIISNLISNALKYSPTEKPVTITLSSDDNRLVLQVRDQGIGIPAEDLVHLFEPFHRASNVGTISGTGLGLNITRQAIEMHGGKIAVESEPDHGTIFTVVLPLLQPSTN